MRVSPEWRNIFMVSDGLRTFRHHQTLILPGLYGYLLAQLPDVQATRLLDDAAARLAAMHEGGQPPVD